MRVVEKVERQVDLLRLARLQLRHEVLEYAGVATNAGPLVVVPPAILVKTLNVQPSPKACTCRLS